MLFPAQYLCFLCFSYLGRTEMLNGPDVTKGQDGLVCGTVVADAVLN